jgi:hypothetical protein
MLHKVPRSQECSVWKMGSLNRAAAAAADTPGSKVMSSEMIFGQLLQAKDVGGESAWCNDRLESE